VSQRLCGELNHTVKSLRRRDLNEQFLVSVIMKLKKGYIQIYTGNGKGKTTAAIGQAVRAAGSGHKTYIAMFMKNYPYGELRSLKHLSEWITVEQFASDEFVICKEPPDEKMINRAKAGLDAVTKKMLCGEFDLIIMDEVFVSIYFGLFTENDVLPIINNKPENVELILTGRYCQPVFFDKADLVTIMKEEKHYYEKGITVRKGIEC